MDSELNELYQQVILDHNKNPRNFRVIEQPSLKAKGHNPLCGDNIELFLVLDGEVIKEIAFNGSGCAISKASASIMTTILQGKTISEAKDMFQKFHELVTAEMDSEPDVVELGKLAVFAGVKEFPARIKCASLAWHTLMNALDNTSETVTTE